MITDRVPLVWSADNRCFARELCVGAVVLDLDKKAKPILSGEVRLEPCETLDEARAVVEREARKMLARAVDPGWRHYFVETGWILLMAPVAAVALRLCGVPLADTVDYFVSAAPAVVIFLAGYHYSLFSRIK